MDDFLFIFDAIFPIVLVILLGYFLRRIRLLNENFVEVGNKLVFKVLLPIYLALNIYRINSFAEIDGWFILYTTIAIFVLFAIGLLIVIFSIKERNRRGVVLQAIFRSNNSIIGIPLALALGSGQAVAQVAILSAIAIPVFNILAVVSLSIFTNEKFKITKVLLDIVKNPLVIGIAVGLVIIGIRSLIGSQSTYWIAEHLTFLYSATDMVGALTTGFSLIVLGAGFRFTSIQIYSKELTIGVIGRLILAPVLVIGVFLLLAKANILDGSSAKVVALIPLFASPVAVSSAIMAKEMNNDEVLANSLVFMTSILSIITIFVLCFVLRVYNFI
ncbi:MAG: AEC family transporter [Acholeplasmatales bacterium]|jgi:predicted permease|nr:AEC family transporter [Acholeplasmatales bacterium]